MVTRPVAMLRMLTAASWVEFSVTRWAARLAIGFGWKSSSCAVSPQGAQGPGPGPLSGRPSIGGSVATGTRSRMSTGLPWLHEGLPGRVPERPLDREGDHPEVRCPGLDLGDEVEVLCELFIGRGGWSPRRR